MADLLDRVIDGFEGFGGATGAEQRFRVEPEVIRPIHPRARRGVQLEAALNPGKPVCRVPGDGQRPPAQDLRDGGRVCEPFDGCNVQRLLAELEHALRVAEQLLQRCGLRQRVREAICAHGRTRHLQRGINAQARLVRAAHQRQRECSPVVTRRARVLSVNVESSVYADRIVDGQSRIGIAQCLIKIALMEQRTGQQLARCELGDGVGERFRQRALLLNEFLRMCIVTTQLVYTGERVQHG